jgi:hypothetical protein
VSDNVQLESEALALLDQANVGILISIPDKVRAKALIVRMRDCSDRATNANLTTLAQRLMGAAEVIEQWLQDQSDD